jgi:hypothetical protein
MDQVTEQEPPENNEQPLAGTEKYRLCRWLLEIAFADDHYATPHFVRSFIARLDQRIRKADYNRAFPHGEPSQRVLSVPAQTDAKERRS